MTCRPLSERAPRLTRMQWRILRLIISVTIVIPHTTIREPEYWAGIRILTAPRVIRRFHRQIRNFLQPQRLYPDAEDLNHDNTLNENEEYFQYRVEIKPSADPDMQIGQNFIVDRKAVGVFNWLMVPRKTRHGTSFASP